MGKPSMDVFSAEELESLLGEQEFSTPAGIALADGRQIAVSGIFSRGTGAVAQGRAGVQTVNASYRFAEHLCEDVREGDGIQVDEVDYTVREATTNAVGITTLQLRRAQ